MVESEIHREMRKKVETRLGEKGVNFISSHSPDSEGVGPALGLDQLFISEILLRRSV